MGFGKDELTVSSAIMTLLYCFLLKLNAAAGKKKHINYIGLFKNPFTAGAEHRVFRKLIVWALIQRKSPKWRTSVCKLKLPSNPHPSHKDQPYQIHDDELLCDLCH